MSFICLMLFLFGPTWRYVSHFKGYFGSWQHTEGLSFKKYQCRKVIWLLHNSGSFLPFMRTKKKRTKTALTAIFTKDCLKTVILLQLHNPLSSLRFSSFSEMRQGLAQSHIYERETRLIPPLAVLLSVTYLLRHVHCYSVLVLAPWGAVSLL